MMTRFEKKYTYDYISTYQRDDLRSDVFRRSDGVYGIEMYKNNTLIKREPYEGKSEAWAQSAAENYVDGIKVI
tara:strand:- start:460 stop:678 length:219 start_codon:yes stop_codon:yes gene_type:complete